MGLATIFSVDDILSTPIPQTIWGSSMINKYRKFQFGENETLDGLTDTHNLNKERFKKWKHSIPRKLKFVCWKTNYPRIPWLFSMFLPGHDGAIPHFQAKPKQYF